MTRQQTPVGRWRSVALRLPSVLCLMGAALVGCGGAENLLEDDEIDLDAVSDLTASPGLHPTADSTVDRAQPTANFGRLTSIRAVGDSKEGLLRFSIPAGSTIQRATLRMYVTGASVNAADVYKATAATWNETSVTWNTRPTAGILVGSITTAIAGRWVEVDVTRAVAPNTVVSFIVRGRSSDGASFASRESEAQPGLVIETSSTPRESTGIQLLATFNAENGVIGQDAPRPLTAVTVNIPQIAGSPVFSGTKSYEVELDRSWPLPYRNEARGVQLLEFERNYWIGYAFRRVEWDSDNSAESFPGQLHESPSTWANWGKDGCRQSAYSTSPFAFHNQNNQFTFVRLGGVPLWSKPIDTTQWHRVVLNIRLSKGNTGFIRSWYDGVEQPRYPSTGTAQTHRADSQLAPGCDVGGVKTTFVQPLLTIGIYKWDWKAGQPVDRSRTTRRRGYVDDLRIAVETTSGTPGNGFDVVNPR